MKQNKGFTLIELLAVIVILAIIALIATPIVLNMIASARKSAAKSSTLGYVDSIEYYAGFAQANVDGIGLDASYNSENLITGTCNVKSTSTPCKEFIAAVSSKHKGSAPEEGYFTVSANGSVSAAEFKYNGYKCTYDATKPSDTKCESGSVSAGTENATLNTASATSQS